jgi:hypothetical protein
MRRPGDSLAATSGALALFLLSDSSRAQAWLPPQGEAFFSLGYGNTFITKHYTYQAPHDDIGVPFQAGDNIEDDRGHIRSQTVAAQVGYAFTDRFTLQFGVPYTEAKWYTRSTDCGTSMCTTYGRPHELPDKRTLDDGQYHGTLADFRIDALYQVIQGQTALTPFVSAVIPSHGYQYFAHSAVGRGLHEYVLGLNFGSSLERIVPGLYVQAMYSYAFVEEVFVPVETIGNVHHDRSNGALEIGYFITPSIGVRFLSGGFYTHGGLVFRAQADFDCGTDGCNGADPIYLHHDQIEHASAIFLGGGLSYALTGSVDVYANYIRTVQGRGGHKIDDGISVGFSWGFSPKQVVRSMFGPRTPVGEAPVEP